LEESKILLPKVLIDESNLESFVGPFRSEQFHRTFPEIRDFAHPTNRRTFFWLFIEEKTGAERLVSFY
jgi:hypothetical protein